MEWLQSLTRLEYWALLVGAGCAMYLIWCGFQKVIDALYYRFKQIIDAKVEQIRKQEGD